MAPFLDQVSDLLQKRFSCPSGSYYDSYYNRCVAGSTWYWYGRWIFAAVVIVLFLLDLFPMGLPQFSPSPPPRSETHVRHWLDGTSQYSLNNPQVYQPPPPAYGAPAQSYPMDNRYQTTDGHYGQQSSGIEPPKNVYGGDYAPPSGPPPNK